MKNEERSNTDRSSLIAHRSVVALLLAAGESSRMGRPKPLLPWHGEPLIAYQVRQLRCAGAADVVAVLGHEAETAGPLVEAAGVRVVLNPRYKEGRASSLRAGAAALPDATDAVIILGVDQPRPAAVIRAVLEAHLTAGSLITTPLYHGRGGHPVVLSGALLPELRAVTEAAEGLRAVVRRHAAARLRVPVEDPIVLVEFNTPAEYAAALSLTEAPDDR
jgi:molybdenum cofactor cytidylyltransferase